MLQAFLFQLIIVKFEVDFAMHVRLGIKVKVCLIDFQVPARSDKYGKSEKEKEEDISSVSV